MEDRPDSAMRLVDSIFYPEKSLRKPQYMQYLVTRVRARYKNYRPVAEDTLVFKATDYFVSKGKDPRRITLAYFYSGCVHRERKEYDKAMQHYKEAEHHAAQTGDADCWRKKGCTRRRWKNIKPRKHGIANLPSIPMKSKQGVWPPRDVCVCSWENRTALLPHSIRGWNWRKQAETANCKVC